MSRPFGRGPKALRIQRERRKADQAKREAAKRDAERLPEAPPVKMSRTRPARKQPPMPGEEKPK